MSDNHPEEVPQVLPVSEPGPHASDSMQGDPIARPPEASLSPWGTTLCSILVAVLIGSLLRFSTATPLDRLENPEGSLERLVTREMDLRDALRRVPAWERMLHLVLSGEEDTLNDSIAWYDELSGAVESPVVQLYRVILLGEAGQANRVITAIVPWEFRDEATARMAGWVRAAYLQIPPAPETGQKLLTEIREGLPSGWFADVLVARVAAEIGDRNTQLEAESAIAARGETLLNRRRIVTVGEMVLLGLGGGMLWRILARRSDVRIGEALVPPGWTIQDGYGLFIRGALGFLVISALVPFLLPKEIFFVGISTLAAGAPMLVWTVRYLAARGASVPKTFGFQPPVGGAVRLGSVTIVLIGLSLAGEAVIAVVGGAFHLKTHWADGLLEDLLWGPSWLAAGVALDSIVWAPIVEEIGFRGVLYATLRTRIKVGPAVLLSAAVFALVHGYGVMGFASVFWSGALWALAYERTRSLIPGMLAHAVNNLLVTGEFVWLVRM